jgi:hypothetical protein
VKYYGRVEGRSVVEYFPSIGENLDSVPSIHTEGRKEGREGGRKKGRRCEGRNHMTTFLRIIPQRVWE